MTITVNCVSSKKNCVHVTGKVDSSNVVTEIAIQRDCLFVIGRRETVTFWPVNFCVVTHVHFVEGFLQKKGVNPDIVHHSEIKYVNDISCVDHLSSVKNDFSCVDLLRSAKKHKCSNCCSRSTCRGQIALVLGKIGSPGGQYKSYNSPQGRLHSPLPVPSKFDQITHYYKLLCQSQQEPQPGGGIASACEQKWSRTDHNSTISRVLKQIFSGSQTQQPVETYTRPQHPEQIFKDRVIQIENPRDNKGLPTGGGVGYLHRCILDRCILPHTDSGGRQFATVSTITPA